MTQEFADRMMTKEQKMRFNEVQQELYSNMQKHQGDLTESLERAAENREQYPEMVIPTDDMIRDIHHGEMTNDEMWERSIEMAHAVVDREAQEAAREQQNSRRSFADKAQDALGSDAIEQAREEQRQAQQRQQSQDQQRKI